jgi:hypothetical protein
MARFITITNPQTQAKAYLFTGDQQDDRSYACTEYAYLATQVTIITSATRKGKHVKSYRIPALSLVEVKRRHDGTAFEIVWIQNGSAQTSVNDHHADFAALALACVGVERLPECMARLGRGSADMFIPWEAVQRMERQILRDRLTDLDVEGDVADVLLGLLGAQVITVQGVNAYVEALVERYNGPDDGGFKAADHQAMVAKIWGAI